MIFVKCCTRADNAGDTNVVFFHPPFAGTLIKEKIRRFLVPLFFDNLMICTKINGSDLETKGFQYEQNVSDFFIFENPTRAIILVSIV